MPRLRCALLVIVSAILALTVSSASADAGKLSGARARTKAASGSDSPTNFYRRLAESVTDLSGHAILYFNAGVWETKSLAAGGTVHWRIDDGTIGDFTVQYSNRALQSAELKFNKPIHIWLPVAGGVSFAISDLKFDQDGNLIDDNRKPDNVQSSHYVGSARTNRIFGIETSPDLMLKGELFSNIDSIAKCNTNNQGCVAANTSLVYEVQLKATPTSPALTVAVGPPSGPGIPNTTTLPISLPGLAGSSPNYIDLQTGSSLVIHDMDYFVDEHYLAGNLENLTLRLADGHIGTGDLSLTLTSGSTFTLQNLSFTHDPTASPANHVEMDNGYLAAGISGGSQIQLSKASAGSPDAESYIVMRDGSSVALHGISIHQDDSGGTTISWDPLSQEKLFIQNGLLNVGVGATVNLASSSIQMNVAGTWSTGKLPAVTATDVQIDANISGAQLPISPATVLMLGAGHMHGQHMTIDSTARPVFRGTVTEFDVVIAPQTTIAFPGAIHLVTTSGGHFSLDPSSPALQFGLGSPYPVGRYVLDVPFSIFDNSAAAANFQLTGGNASLPIETIGDAAGTIQTPISPNPEAWVVKGKLALYPSGSNPLNIDVTISSGLFHTSQSGHPSFTGTFSGTAEKGFSWAFTTPSIGMAGQPTPPDNSSLRVYPLNLTLALTSDAVIPASTITIGDNGMTSFSSTFQMNFTLTPASGKGEHEADQDPNSADGTHGSPDPPVHGWQEALQVGGPLGCQYHIYVGPTTHSGSLTATLAINPSSVSVSIPELHFDQDFALHTDYETDGCSGKLLGTILGGLLGGFPGAVGGNILGHVVDNKADDVVKERLNSYVNGLGGQSWTIHYAH